LHTGTLRRVLPGEDDGAGGTLPGEVVTYPFQGIQGGYGVVTAGLGGIPRDAGRIEILASSLDAQPQRLDLINIESGWWLVREVAVDPARSWWDLQCEATAAPT
jgi:hypothetical protein